MTTEEDEKMHWPSSPASTVSLKGLATFLFIEGGSKINQKDLREKTYPKLGNHVLKARV